MIASTETQRQQAAGVPLALLLSAFSAVQQAACAAAGHRALSHSTPSLAESQLEHISAEMQCV